MNETILAKAILTTRAPKGYKGQIIATAQAYKLGGNQHPHFSVTGEISTPSERNRDDAQCGGCIHGKILKAFPKLAPLIALHLSNADDGEPMYAVGNGFYDLAGSVSHHFGKKYHMGNSQRHFPCTPPTDKPWQNTEYRLPTESECLSGLAERIRITIHQATAIRQTCLDAYSAGAATVSTSAEVTPQTEEARAKAGGKAAKAAFAAFCDTLRPQWLQEAKDGLALIQSLAQPKPLKNRL